jgi:AraC-like DNA-binding protein
MHAEPGARRPSVVEMPTYAPETISRLFINLEVDSAERINSRFLVSPMGELSLIRSSHISRNCVSRRLQRHMTDGDSSYFFACAPLQGQLRIQHFGRSCLLKCGDLGFVTTDEEYVIEMSDTLDALWLRIPATLLLSHVAGMKDVVGRTIDVSRGIGVAATELMLVSSRTSDDLGDRAARLVGQSILGFIGELVNSTQPGDLSQSTAYRRKILGRAMDFVEQHLGDEALNPEAIAHGIGIGRRYLSQIFAAEGLSAMRWVLQRRLERCRMEIERCGLGSVPIHEIAYRFGFSNISSFNRAFKAHFGCSPRLLFSGADTLLH